MVTTRRAGARLCRSLAFGFATTVAVVSGTEALSTVRFRVSADGTPVTTTDLGELVTELVAGGDLWPPAARWAVAGVLLLAVLVLGAVGYRLRRRRPPAVTLPARPRLHVPGGHGPAAGSPTPDQRKRCEPLPLIRG